MVKYFENKIVLFSIAIVYCVLSVILIGYDIYYSLALPVVILAVWAAIFKIKKFLLALVFIVPVSFQLSEVIAQKLPVDMFLPSEPFIVMVLLLFILQFARGLNFNKDFLRHPVSLVIYAYLTWMLVTVFTSTMPLESLKLFANRLWFLVPFYFMFGMFFMEKKTGRKFVLNYILGLCIVVVYASYRMYIFGDFEEKISHWAANPFFKDHTSYGALVAFMIPPSIGLVFCKKYSFPIRMLLVMLAVILLIGLVLSYSRAAWISLVGSLCLLVAIRFKIKFKWIFGSLSIIALAIFLFGESIMINLSRNNQDSSDDITEHIQSVSNISTDASNLERINRWKCAIAMFKEKPVFGWGPGTYADQYAPFQLSTDKTIISTRQGDVGNAHSEYLSALSEQGLIGLLLFIAIIVSTMYYGIKAIHRTSSPEMKILGVSAILGLFTYYLHSFLNNFLDMDKAAVPFWGFTALLVAIDVYYRKQDDKSVGGEETSKIIDINT